MAEDQENSKLISEFPSSLQLLGLDKLFSPDTNYTSGNNGDSNIYTIVLKNVFIIAEKIESELQTMKDVIFHKDREILQLTDKIKHIEETSIREHKLIEEVKSVRRELSRYQSKVQRLELEADKLNKEKNTIEEENSTNTIKMKWAQNKLKSELENHISCKSELETTKKRLQQLSEEKYQIHTEFKKIILQYQTNETAVDNNKLTDAMHSITNNGTASNYNSSDSGGVHLQKEIIDSLKAEIFKIGDELKKSKQSHFELSENVDKLTQDKHSLWKQVEKGEKWKQKSEQYKSDVEKLSSQISALNDESRLYRDSNTELKGNLKPLTDLNQMQQKKLTQQENKYEKLNLKYEQLNKEHTLIKYELSTTKQELSVTNNLLNELKQKSNSLVKENEGLNESCNEYEKISHKMEDKIANEIKLEQTIDNLKTEINSRCEDIRRYSIKEQELIAENVKSKEKIANLNGTICELECQITQLQSELISVKQSLENGNVQLNELQNVITRKDFESKQEIARLSEALELKSMHESELQREIEDKTNQMRIIEKKQNTQMKEVSKLLKSHAEQSLERNKLNPPLSPRTKERSESKSSLNSDSERSNGDIPVLLSTIDQFANKIEKLQLELNEKSWKLNFDEEHIKRLTSELQKKSHIIQNFVISNTSTSTNGSLHPKVVSPQHIINLMSPKMFAPEDRLNSEIFHKQQILVDDSLSKNITLQQSLDFLSTQMQNLTAENIQLKNLLDKNSTQKL